MRVREILNEMPLNSFSLHGDFSQEGSFDQKNVKLLSNPKYPLKMEKLLTNTPYSFDIYVVNIDIDIAKLKFYLRGEEETYYTDKIQRNVGQYSTEEVAEKIKINLKSNPTAITFIIAGNTNGDHPLSAWMIIHRLIHAIEDGSGSDWKTNHEIEKPIFDHLKAFKRIVLRTFWHEEKQNPGRSLMRFAEELATMRSADKLSNSEEIYAELLTQFLVRGKIALKTNQTVEEKLNIAARNLFDACVGKIFVGM